MNTKTVDMTPTWEGSLSMLLLILEQAETESARNTAREELRRMAKLADLYAQFVKGGA